MGHLCSHIATKCDDVMMTRLWMWTRVEVLKGAGKGKMGYSPLFFFLYGELRAIVFMYNLLLRANLCSSHGHFSLTDEETEALKNCSNAQSHPKGIGKQRFKSKYVSSRSFVS